MAYDPTKETRELGNVIFSNDKPLIRDRPVAWNSYTNFIVSQMPIKTYSLEEMQSKVALNIGVIRQFKPLNGMDVETILKSDTTARNKFLPCDGRVLDRYVYPKLFWVIGHTFSNETKDSFNLPDLRSMNPVPMISTDAIEPETKKP